MGKRQERIDSYLRGREAASRRRGRSPQVAGEAVAAGRPAQPGQPPIARLGLALCLSVSRSCLASCPRCLAKRYEVMNRGWVARWEESMPLWVDQLVPWPIGPNKKKFRAEFYWYA
jgi:hypothetical protein